MSALSKKFKLILNFIKCLNELIKIQLLKFNQITLHSLRHSTPLHLCHTLRSTSALTGVSDDEHRLLFPWNLHKTCVPLLHADQGVEAVGALADLRLDLGHFFLQRFVFGPQGKSGQPIEN